MCILAKGSVWAVTGVQGAWPAEFGAAGSLRDGFLITHLQNPVYPISIFLLPKILCFAEWKRNRIGVLRETSWEWSLGSCWTGLVGLVWDQLRSGWASDDLGLAGSEFSHLAEFNLSAGQSQWPVTRPVTTVPPFQLEQGIGKTRSLPQPFWSSLIPFTCSILGVLRELWEALDMI